MFNTQDSWYTSPCQFRKIAIVICVHRLKQEEAERKKAEEKARREQIYQQYLHRKQHQEDEENGTERPQERPAKSKPRPKSMFVKATNSPPHDDEGLVCSLDDLSARAFVIPSSGGAACKCVHAVASFVFCVLVHLANTLQQLDLKEEILTWWIHWFTMVYNTFGTNFLVVFLMSRQIYKDSTIFLNDSLLWFRYISKRNYGFIVTCVC